MWTVWQLYSSTFVSCFFKQVIFLLCVCTIRLKINLRVISGVHSIKNLVQLCLNALSRSHHLMVIIVWYTQLHITVLYFLYIRSIINDQIMICAEGARHFACTGVFIDCYPARILTSASLVRSSDDKSKIYDNLRVSTGMFDHYLLYAHL